MEFREALDVLQLTDVEIDSDFEKKAKKKYRSLVLKYHTDIAGDEYADKIRDVISAYDVIKKFWRNESAVTVIRDRQSCIIIGLQDLIDIHQGKELQCSGGIKLNRKNMHNHYVIVECIVGIEYDNNRVEFRGFNRYGIQSVFTVNCDITVLDKSKEIEVKVSCSGHTKTLRICGQSIKYILTLEYNTKVAIVINKKTPQIE